MLSLIICSKFPETSDVLLENIADTVGCEYEIIHIDNSKGQYSIFQAYNKGACLSRGDNLCFMHEDLFFHTKDWGFKVENYLKDSQIGVLGVAGVGFVPVQGDARMCGYAWRKFNWDRYYTLEKNPRSVLDRNTFKSAGHLYETAVVDGLWFCMPRSLFQFVKFDDDTYGGFHLYDLDISMQALMTGRKVMLCDDIIVEHDSVGIFNDMFADNLDRFIEKWKNELPLSRGCDMPDDVKMRTLTINAVERLQKRIKSDKLRTAIQYRYKTEEHQTFSEEERKVIERSIQVYYRASFQNASALECSRLLLECLRERNHSFKLNMNVIGKYLLYGLIRKDSRL
ncbi:MAG: glycosyltransferase family protein [Bacteroidaceae bacterium]|nr:glycosyltransferase family protein [Bacteroidaceae bacterium]